jgi:hypothetical protein
LHRGEDERVHAVIVRRRPGRGRADVAADWLAALPARVLARAGVRRAVLYERRLEAPGANDGDSSLEHRWLDRDDVVHLAALTGDGVPELLARLDRGERCFGSLRGGRLVASRWVATGAVEAHYLRLGVRLPAGDAWVFDSWTDPLERGRGVAAEASAELGRALAVNGTTRLVAIVMPGNRPGKTAVVRSGYRELGTITAIRAPRGRTVRFRARNGQPYS